MQIQDSIVTSTAIMTPCCSVGQIETQLERKDLKPFDTLSHYVGGLLCLHLWVFKGRTSMSLCQMIRSLKRIPLV